MPSMRRAAMRRAASGMVLMLVVATPLHAAELVPAAFSIVFCSFFKDCSAAIACVRRKCQPHLQRGLAARKTLASKPGITLVPEHPSEDGSSRRRSAVLPIFGAAPPE